MPSADEYRVKAADMMARARRESNLLTRMEYENLAIAYFRLADQADKNARTDIVYETPSSEQPQVQQQQQPQPQPQPQPEKEDC